MSIRGGDRLTPFIARIRDFFLQRKYNNSLRYADHYSKRTQPEPNLPVGVNHHLSENEYYTRDDRRLAKRPIDIYEFGPKRIASADGPKQSIRESSTGIFPGAKHQWDAPLTPE